MSDGVFESMLNKTAAITRKAEGQINSLGEPSITEGSVFSSIPVCVQPLREALTVVRAGREYAVSCVAYTNILAVQVDDILTVEDEEYLIVGIENEGGQDHHYRLLLEKR